MKSSYEKIRNAAFILSIVAGGWLFFAADLTISISAGPAQVLLKHGFGRALIFIFIVTVVGFNWESLKLSAEDASHWQIKVERAVVNLLVVASVALLFHHEFPDWTIWIVTPIEGSSIAIAGVVSGFLWHIVLWVIKFIRTSDEARQKKSA
jgi:hypothetical protein